MKSDPFYFEIKDVMTQFVAAFNDIIIKRHNKYKEVRNRLKVRYVYAPKQRVIHDLTNKARHLTLPVVAVNIAGISRDPTRVFNKIYGQYLSEFERKYRTPGTQNKNTTFHIPQPVPININVTMSILARYQTDVEQIISNFIPYNDPYIIISWKMPGDFYSKDVEIRSEIEWDGNLSMVYPENLTGSDPYRLSCDTSFTIKTWLFKKAPEKPIDTIFKITTNTTLTDDFSLNTPLHNELTQTSYINTFGPTLTAAPHITYVSEYGQNRTVLGYNMTNTTNVYVSSNELNELSGVSVDIHGDKPISTHFPAFTAVPVEYEIVNDNEIYVKLPHVSEDQSVDLIVENEGGYGSAINSEHHGDEIIIYST